MPKEKQRERTFTLEELNFGTNYNVMLLNSHIPGEYVIEVLVEIFNKSPIEAYNIMMEVEKNGPENGPSKGRAVIETYSSREDADAAVNAVGVKNKLSGYNLEVFVEEE